MPLAIRDFEIQDVPDDEVEYELASFDRQFGPHINSIPMASAVAGPRNFYGDKFTKQALPLAKPEAPLVQSLMAEDPNGRSFDEYLGEHAGAIRAQVPGRVLKITADEMTIKGADGKTHKIDLYNNMPFNRKSAITQRPRVQPGDDVTPGQLLAVSDYTDDNGTLAIGANARIGVVPYKGFTLDDAVAISKSFADRLAAKQTYTMSQKFDRTTKGGLNSYTALYPDKFTRDQLKSLDEHGVVLPGTVVNQGDPMILATTPRMISSADTALGGMSRSFRSLRQDAAQVWDSQDPGLVKDVVRARDGTVKLIVEKISPARVGDKLALRSGQKGVISHVIPDDHMPRTVDGKPLELLLNPQGIPSRVNDALLFELALGKIAAATGQPVKVPLFTKPGERWLDIVRSKLKEAGIQTKEEVFDPLENRKLENPINVGNGFILRLHHTAESKTSSRGQAAYDQWEQPLKGGDEAAQSKRLSGLEMHGMLSSGAVANIREGMTVRGQKLDDFWRRIRAGQTPPKPGRPFAFNKMKMLMSGAGYFVKEDLKNGTARLGPFTDAHLEQMAPMEVKSGDMVDLHTLEPIPGGLFDPALVTGQRWGRIPLPEVMPNPAMEEAIRILLDLPKKEFRAVLAGTQDLQSELRWRKMQGRQNAIASLRSSP